MATNNMTLKHTLPYYLERICAFIEGSKKTISFPGISSQLEEVLVRIITESPKFLNSDQYDVKARLEATKLIASMEELFSKSLKLTHDFIEEKDGQKVLNYKKETVESFKAPTPMRKPSQVLALPSNSVDNLVTSAFKTRCLNDTTKFVKDDLMLVMRYPEMSAAQAEFVMQMLMQAKDGNSKQMNVGYGFRSIYAPLWECMHLFRSKYRYRIDFETCADNNGRKIVIFEKIPKQKVEKIMEVDVPALPIEISSSDSSTNSRSSSPVIINSSSTSKSIPRSKNKLSKSVKKINKLIRLLKRYREKKELTGDFIEEALQSINNFVMSKQEASLIFDGISIPQYYFLRNVEKICKNDPTYMLFSSASQQYLSNIKYWLHTVQYAIFMKKYPDRKKMRQVTFRKQPVFQEKSETESKKDVSFTKQAVVLKNSEQKTEKSETKKKKENDEVANALDLIPLSLNAQEKLEGLKNIKDRVSQTSGEEFITNTLQDISEFLLKSNKNSSLVYEKASSDEYLFLKYVNVLSKMDAAYAMFSRECQQLLSMIKTRAKNYELKFSACNIDDEDVETLSNIFITITKKDLTKVDNQEDLKRARSLGPSRPEKANPVRRESALNGRGASTQRLPSQRAQAKLLEGLAQPVHSDKAMKIMQSMGWKGGALGLRGNGITEPIALSLDLSKGAGFGAPKIEPKPPKVKMSKKKMKKPPPPLPTQTRLGKVLESNSSTLETAQDTRQDSKQDKSALLLQGILPFACIPTNLLPPGIHPPGMEKTMWKSKTLSLEGDYRMTILNGILELVTTELEAIQFVFNNQKVKPRKIYGFVENSVNMMNIRKPLVMLPAYEERGNVILKELRKLPGLIFGTSPPSDKKKIVIWASGLTQKRKRILQNNNDISTEKTNLQIQTNSQEWFKEIKTKPKKAQAQTTTNTPKQVVQTITSNEVIGTPAEIPQGTLDTQKFVEMEKTLFQKPLQETTVEIQEKILVKNESELVQTTEIKKHLEICLKPQENETKVSEKPVQEISIETVQEVTNTYKIQQVKTTDSLNPTTIKSSDRLKEVLSINGQKHEFEITIPHKPKERENKLIQISMKETVVETGQKVVANNTSHELFLDDAPSAKEMITQDTHKPEANRTNTPKQEITTTEEPEIETSEKSQEAKTIETQNNLEQIKESQKGALSLQEIVTGTTNLNINETLTETQHQQDKITKHAEKITEIQNIPNKIMVLQNLPDKSIETANSDDSTKDALKQVNILANGCSSVKKDKFKYFSLIHILDFCRSNQTIKIIQLKTIVPPKMMAYVYIIISLLKIRSEFSGPNIEMVMFERIKSAMSDYDLHSDFDTPKTIVLYKIPCGSTNNNSTTENLNMPTTAQKVDNSTNSILSNSHDKSEKVININRTNIDIKVGKNSDGTSSVEIIRNKKDAVKDAPKENTEKFDQIDNNIKPIHLINNNKSDMVKDTENILTVETVSVADKSNVKASNNTSDDSKIVRNSHSDTKTVRCLTILHDNVVDIETETTQSKLAETSNINLATDSDAIMQYKDGDCQIIIDNSECQVDSGEENLFLFSDTETDGTSKSVAIDKAKEIMKHLKLDEFQNALLALENVDNNVCNEVKVKIDRDESNSPILDSRFRKRVSVESINEIKTLKKCKLLADFKKVCILHKDYPQIKIDSEKAHEIQNIILNAIDFTKQNLPVLSCQGLGNGGIIYSCHDENSVFFIEDCIKTMDEYRIVYEFDDTEKLVHKMAFRMNSFIDEDFRRIMNRLELYNMDLNVSKWAFIKKEQYNDFIVIYVEIDECSFRYVCDANFVLHAGNDCAMFTIVWD